MEIVTKTVPGSDAYLDMGSLDADTQYYVDFISKIGEKKNPALQLSAATGQYHINLHKKVK